jgi:hypothetical protein
MMGWTCCDGQGAEKSDASGLSGGFTPTFSPETRILLKNMFFCGCGAGLHRKSHPAAVGGILDFGGFAAIAISCVLQPKGHATPHTNLAALRLSIATDWDRLMAV